MFVENTKWLKFEAGKLEKFSYLFSYLYEKSRGGNGSKIRHEMQKLVLIEGRKKLVHFLMPQTMKAPFV